MIVGLPILLALIAAVAEIFLEKTPKNQNNFRRWLAITVSISGLAVFGFKLSQLSQSTFLGSNELFVHIGNQTPPLIEATHWGFLFCLIQSTILLVGSLLCPKVPLARIRMSRVYLLYCGVICLSITSDIRVFLFVALLCYLVLTKSAQFHINSFSQDTRKEARVHAFTFYQQITSVGILIALIDHLYFASSGQSFTTLGIIASSIACFSSIGIFPFHSWVVPFIGAPRSTIFLPMFVMELGLLILFKLYAPLVSTYPILFNIGIVLSVIGLLHAAFSFFGETRLKRIPAYLYLSHISLMILSLNELGHGGEIASALDSANLLIASCGLISVCALLTGRLGIKGVLYPTGLASNFPELGICFLICALSLVGFPGTLGFIEEEFMLEAGAESHLALVILITFALTINGFSCFRLFARIFYGARPTSIDSEISLSTREKIVLWGLLMLLIINGFAPNLLLRVLMSQ